MPDDEHDAAAYAEACLRGWYADEISRLGFQAGSMSRGLPQRPSYAGEVQLSAGPAEVLSADDIAAATAELSESRGEDLGETQAQLLRLSGGQRDTASMAAAIGELSIMPATATVSDDRARLADYAALSASGRGDAIIGGEKVLRDLAARLGIDVSSLPGFKGDRDQKRADARHASVQALGITASDVLRLSRGEDAELAGRVELAAGLAAMSPEEAKIADVISRHSNSDLFREAPRGRRRGEIAVHSIHGKVSEGVAHPVGRNVTTATRAHASRNHTDQQGPRRGGQAYPGVGSPAGTGGADDVASRHPELFAKGEGAGLLTSNRPRGNTGSYGPKSLAQRQAEETRALGGGRAQNRIHD
jgi:hypothetical protein